MMHPHFFELRFLLHGSLDHYDRDDDLFIPDDSKGRDLWKIVADCILKPWQVIDPQLFPFIYSIKEQLKIKKLDRDDIIDRLGKDPHAVKNITHQKLTESQIIELLNQIYYCGDPKKSLWLNLVLHKTSKGHYVSVTGETYLESEDSVPKALEDKIIIIKSIQGLHQNWISSWSNKIAIDKLIALLEEDSFQDQGLIASDLLNLLSASNANQRKILREIQWVPSRSGSNVDYYAPKEVVIFNKDAKGLVSKQLLAEYGYCEISNLDTKYQSNAKFKELCSGWNYKDLLSFLLKDIFDPSRYSTEIYEILIKINNSDLDEELKKLIKEDKNWIPLKKSKLVISTDKIIYHKSLSTNSLTKPIIDEIVEILEDYYTYEDCKIDILNLYSRNNDLFLDKKETFNLLVKGLNKIPRLNSRFREI